MSNKLHSFLDLISDNLKTRATSTLECEAKRLIPSLLPQWLNFKLAFGLLFSTKNL